MRPIFIDLDETLLNDKKQISERTLDALAQVRERGYEPVICTGRAFGRAILACETAGCRYLIFCEGAGIYDNVQKKLLYENPIDGNVIVKLCEMIKDEDVHISVSTGDLRCIVKERLFDAGVKKYFTPLCDRDIIINEAVENFVENHKSLKFQVLDIKLETIRRIKGIYESAMAAGLSADIRMTNQSRPLTDPTLANLDTGAFYDIGHARSSKGFGVIKFCELFNIDKKDTICIGDDINDIAMFEECGYTVAMANAIPEIKNMADYVTASNNDDGVAKFLDKLEIRV
jgi:hypothetical protein